ncbi:MAG: VanW family protein [Verrucomicrobiales bacterium]
MQTIAKEGMPTRVQSLVFELKAACFRVRRGLGDLRRQPQRFSIGAIDAELPVVAESRSLLYASQLGAEFGLQAGKVQNLRIAAQHLNGLTIPAGQVFSFWRHVPRPTRRRGFVAGRELREGCVIPNVGGGLCQLSNALYDAALKAGLEIVERHGHSRILPGSMASDGRDATIFWNYVDLRFQAASAIQLEVLLGRGELVVRFRSRSARPAEPGSATPRTAPPGDAVESCETCGVTSCFRHPETLDLDRSALSAWLVDAYWPEHDRYLRDHRTDRDWLFVPSTRGRYAWDCDGFAERREAPWLVARRSITSRRLAAQGARRQRALLGFDESLAKSYASRIPAAATHLIVSQNLLPFLWRDGVLGGRSFDVLMTRLPMSELQATLDRAALRWPDSPTLADFRADPALLTAEKNALAEARHWISPHSAIAKLAGDRAIKLDWQLPEPAATTRTGNRLLFPATTLGRKGAWELRELGIPLTIAGPDLEAPDFWNGREIERLPNFSLDGVRAVVLPAWVENQPRRLLQAIATNIPVIASDACGLAGMPGVTTFDPGDINALRAAIDAKAAPTNPTPA